MKRYALLILVVFLLLLLIPLPALGILGGDKPPVSSSEGSSSGSSSPSGSSAPSADEDSFKVLDVKSGEVLEVGMRDFQGRGFFRRALHLPGNLYPGGTEKTLGGSL